MLIWINGTFGVGKSTTAAALAERPIGYRLFDPEHVGYMLMANLRGIEFSDFQDLHAWRQLVPVVARQVESTTGQQLIAVQTVLNHDYWAELRSGLDNEGFDVLHVVLDADVDTLVARIRADEQDREAEQWRLDHVQQYLDAKPWLIEDADLVVDLSKMSTGAAVDQIIAALA